MALEKFLRYLRHEKRFSPHTLKAYNSDILQFEGFLKEHFGIENISLAGHLSVRAWIVSMMESGISERTVNRKITSLNTYCKFLMRDGIIAQNPMAKIHGPRMSKKLPAFVDQGKMEMLFDKIDFGNDFRGRRDRLILSLFYQSGMRLSELSNLRVKDFNRYESSLKVLGKRNKERQIPVMSSLSQNLQLFIDELEPGTEFIFVDEKMKQLNQKYIYRMVREKLGAVTSSERRSPHILRHTFATHMLENGAEINAIKELLGHASLAATQVYTHNTIEKLKAIHKQAHPKS